jgi:hypothetical protein
VVHLRAGSCDIESIGILKLGKAEGKKIPHPAAGDVSAGFQIQDQATARLKNQGLRNQPYP